MSRKNKRNKSKYFIWAGVLLIVAALSLALYNVGMDKRAGEYSETVLAEIKRLWEDRGLSGQDSTERGTDADGSADESEDKGAATLKDKDTRPIYERFPDMEMPTMEIDGKLYIGVLTVPTLGLELPVLSEWSYPNLRLSPCRVSGSVYSGDIIIAAHNYDRHFGRLKNLSPDDEVNFTDADGNLFRYEVAALETLPGTAVEEMESGDWDMTLFTCTIGGKSRVTVRCEKKAV